MMRRSAGGTGGATRGNAASGFVSPEAAIFQETLACDPTEAMRWRSSKTHTAIALQAHDGSVVHEGYLVKKGHVLRTHKERYFVLRQHTLSYFRAKWGDKKAKPTLLPASLKGVLELAATDIVTPAPHSDVWFRIQKLADADTKSYKLDLKATSATERQQWIDAIRSVCRTTLLVKQQAMLAASARLHRSRDATIIATRITTLPSLVDTIVAGDAKTQALADLRASFVILHELVLLQQLVEAIKTTWGPPAEWSTEQYQTLVQSISLAHETAGTALVASSNAIVAEAFALRYAFEEVATNQSKLQQLRDAQHATADVVLSDPQDPLATPTARRASGTLPPTPPRLRCPTIYSYYSTFEQLSLITTNGQDDNDSSTIASDSAALPPLTPRSATLAKYAHLYLEDDVRTRKPWSWDRSKGDDLIDGENSSRSSLQHVTAQLCDRYANDKIYTLIHDHSMVLINPYRILQTSKFTSIYDEHVVLTYALTPRALTQLAPHPFAMAKHALLRLFYAPRSRRDVSVPALTRMRSQLLLLSGESGSGKTELAKELLKYVVLSAQPTALTAAQGRCRPRIQLFTSSTKSTTQMRTEETRTMALLAAKGIDQYEIVLLDLFPDRWSEMTRVSKSKRIPQVHIDGLFFGFYETLERLEDEEQLRMYVTNPHAAHKLSTVLDANILLEAFGNAATATNANSSRFGKVTTLSIAFGRHPSAYQIVGCRLDPFLLEKSRVTSARVDAAAAFETNPQPTSDTNFHVFYALVAGVNVPNASPRVRLLAKDLRLDGATSASFAFLGTRQQRAFSDNVSTAADDAVKKDVERWQHVVEALKSMDVAADAQCALFQILSAILWLGNVEFVYDNSTNKLTVATLLDGPAAAAATNVVALLGLDSVASLEQLLMTKHIAMASTGESFDVVLEKGQVTHRRDTFARLLYETAFTYLITLMNDATRVDAALENDGTNNRQELYALQLVDVFGFENLPRNSLEQLCINYLSEKLFVIEQQVVAAHYSSSTSSSNSSDVQALDVLYLFEHPLGVFASLEELTMLHQSENESAQQATKKNELLVRNLYARNATRLLNAPRSGTHTLLFTVPHARASVTYDAAGFVAKNSDFAHMSLLDGLELSTNAHVRALLATVKRGAAAIANAPHKKETTAETNARSLTSQFRTQIHMLAAQESGNDVSMPLFMHCIRPNDAHRPAIVDSSIVERQLQSHRLVPQVELGYAHQHAIALSTAPAYVAITMPISFFMRRYRSLWTSRLDVSDTDAIHQCIEALLSTNDAPSYASAATQRTVVVSDLGVRFASVATVECLDLLLEVRQSEAAVTLQAFARMLAHRQAFRTQQQSRQSLVHELVDLYGANSMQKIEKIVTKYAHNERELRAKIAVKQRTLRQTNDEIAQLAQDLQDLCLSHDNSSSSSSSSGLQVETVNELLANAHICAQLQQNERIVAALRDMSLDPNVLPSQLAEPALRAFYHDVVAVLKDKRAHATFVASAPAIAPSTPGANIGLSLDERMQRLVAHNLEMWKAAARSDAWSAHCDTLDEIGDEPEMLVFHADDAAFVAMLESFVAHLEAQLATNEQQEQEAAALQQTQAHAAAVQTELLEMLLTVELNERLMAAMRDDAYFVQALEHPVLIASMQQFATNRDGFGAHGGLENPLVRDFFLRLIKLSLSVQAAQEL